MNAIAHLDARLFHVINGQLTAPVLDFLMPFITDKFNFLGVIILGSVLILIRGNKRDISGLVLLVIVVLSSDLAASVLKNLVTRVRPCHALEGVRLLAGCGRSYSFPSGHSTNIFAAMVFLSTRYKRFYPAFLFVAFSVAYSRVYVGVHYPLDIAGGAALGTAFALLFAEADRRYLHNLIENLRNKRDSFEA